MALPAPLILRRSRPISCERILFSCASLYAVDVRSDFLELLPPPTTPPGPGTGVMLAAIPEPLFVDASSSSAPIATSTACELIMFSACKACRQIRADAARCPSTKMSVCSKHYMHAHVAVLTTKQAACNLAPLDANIRVKLPLKYVYSTLSV